MSSVRISMLGKLGIQRNEQDLVDLESRRAQELLCYLLLYRERLHEREKLACLLWGESSTAHSKRNLRQTLWQLQAALNSCCNGEKLLIVDNGWIGINSSADYWLDIAALEQAFTHLQTLDNPNLNQQQALMLEQVVKYYKGDLMEGCYQDWCIYERERYQTMYLTILDHLLRYGETNHDYQFGIVHVTFHRPVQNECRTLAWYMHHLK